MFAIDDIYIWEEKLYSWLCEVLELVFVEHEENRLGR